MKNLKSKLAKRGPRLGVVQRTIWGVIRLIVVSEDTSPCKPRSLALTRMAVGRDGLSEEVTEVFIGRRRTNSNAYG